MRRFSRLRGSIVTCVALLACGDGGELVALEPDASGDARDATPVFDARPADDARGPQDASLDTSSADAASPDARMTDAGSDAGGLVAVPDPGSPAFPGTIGTLSVSIRTGDGMNAGTDANQISLCLSASDCWTLNVRDVNDFRVGEMDVYHFEGVGLPRASVDRVELRSMNGTDAWQPACMEIRFDGEPVYCRDELGITMGNGSPTEIESYRDPEGLAQQCRTCWPTSVTHGPMLGAMEPDEARVWVRTDATRPVTLRVSETARAADGPTVAWAYPSPLQDFAAVLHARGLAPSRTYTFQVEVDGEAVDGAAGSFTTAPAAGTPGTLRFAFGSCSRLDAQPIFGPIAALDPQLFFFVGDNHYGNTNDRDSLRWFYRWGLERPLRAALVASTPTLATWDDHDYVGNNTDGAAPGKAAALRVFAEYWAHRSVGTDAVPGVFHRYSWGDVDFFFVDDRYHRGEDASILGNAQTAWLADALAESSAVFKVVACGSQWTLTGSSDSWAAFPAARDALLRQLADRGVEGIVLLSGDIHRSELRLLPGPGAMYDVPELTSSPLANTTSSCSPDSELRDCYDDGPSFLSVDIDTTVADPTLTAVMRDATGGARATWTIRRSSLDL